MTIISCDYIILFKYLDLDGEGLYSLTVSLAKK